MNKDIFSRFFYSLAGNILRGSLSFLISILLARLLEPDHYGQYIYLIATFSAFRQILDAGTSSAFFTFISKKKRDFNFVKLYFFWMLFQYLVSSLFLFYFLSDAIIGLIWPNQSRVLILLAFTATFIQGVVWNASIHIAESLRMTAQMQKISTFLLLFQLFTILLLWKLNSLGLYSIFLSISIEWFICSIFILKKSKKSFYSSVRLFNSDFKKIINEYLVFCIPLIPYSLLSFTNDFTDRWMLQRWSGSREQAYLGISLQFSSILMLLTISILRIFWKEIAESYEKGKKKQLKILYFRVSKSLYFFSCIFVCGLLPWTKNIFTISLGDKYTYGHLTFFLMLIYTIHQSLGQISNTLLLATNKTREQLLVGSITTIFGLITAYFLIAPQQNLIPGLGLMSLGLALKMTLIQILSVNLTMWLISKIFNWKYEWKFQVIIFLVFFGLSFLTYFLTILFSNLLFNILIKIFIFLIIYSFLILYVVNKYPFLLGISQNKYCNLKSKILKQIKTLSIG